MEFGESDPEEEEQSETDQTKNQDWWGPWDFGEGLEETPQNSSSSELR